MVISMFCIYYQDTFESLVVFESIEAEGRGSTIQVGHGATRVRALNTSLTETTVSLVQIDKQFLPVINGYVPLHIEKMALLSILDNELESLTKYRYPIIITGDLKIDILKRNKPTKDYLCTLAGNGFHLTNNAPTRDLAENAWWPFYWSFSVTLYIRKRCENWKRKQIFPFWEVLKNQLSSKTIW